MTNSKKNDDRVNKIRTLLEDTLERFDKVDSKKGRVLAIAFGMKLLNTLVTKFHLSEGMELSIDRKLNNKLLLVTLGKFSEKEMFSLVIEKLKKLLKTIERF